MLSAGGEGGMRITISLPLAEPHVLALRGVGRPPLNCSAGMELVNWNEGKKGVEGVKSESSPQVINEDRMPWSVDAAQ